MRTLALLPVCFAARAFADAHTEYESDVTLELRRDSTRPWRHLELVLHGYEAYGCYVQTFDPATGRRLSARMASLSGPIR